MKLRECFIITLVLGIFSFQLKGNDLDKFKNWYSNFIQKEVVILDSNGKETIPNFPEGTKTVSPFGLFFRLIWEGENGYQQGVCNLTHLTQNKAVTASHCLKKIEKLPDPFFAFLYFDKKGERHFKYISREKILDLPQYQSAILDLENDTSEEWNTLDLDYFEYPKEKIDKLPRQSFKTFLYVFDSIQSDAAIQKKFKEGTQGWIFRKKE